MSTAERTSVPEHFVKPPTITDPQKAFILKLLEQRNLAASEKFAQEIESLNAEQLEVFMKEMRERVPKLTKAQASEWITRLKALPYKKQVREDAQASEVPDGHYALEHEDDDLNPIRFYRVRHGKDNTDKGGRNWEGYIFVDRYSSDDTFPVKGKQRYEVLRRIAEDPLRAAQLYGQHYEKCCICNRRLTRKLSREMGIGPICGARNGWIDDAFIDAARDRIVARGENPDEEVA